MIYEHEGRSHLKHKTPPSFASFLATRLHSLKTIFVFFSPIDSNRHKFLPRFIVTRYNITSILDKVEMLKFIAGGNMTTCYVLLTRHLPVISSQSSESPLHAQKTHRPLLSL